MCVGVGYVPIRATIGTLVKEHLDGVLTELIAELVQIKPEDPIEWLANALRQYSRKQQAKVCLKMSSKSSRCYFKCLKNLCNIT